VASAFYWLSYLLVVGAGSSAAFQAILNAKLRAQIGSPWWAGFVSFFVGMVGMLVLALFSSGPRPSASWIENASWFSWTGGLFGAIFIGAALIMVPRLGGATVFALLVVGQMLGSLVFDHFGILGIPQHPINALRVAGAAFLILGVVLIRM
jgi:transporter family-2 protein